MRITLKERQIVAEPFLIAGILVCIKEIVVLAVKAPTDYLDKGPEFARAMVEVGLLGVLVLVLAGTTVLLRKKEKEPEENAGTDSASEGTSSEAQRLRPALDLGGAVLVQRLQRRAGQRLVRRSSASAAPRRRCSRRRAAASAPARGA